MMRNNIISAINLLIGFLIGSLIFISLSITLLHLTFGDEYNANVLWIPAVIGGFSGLTVTLLILKTQNKNRELKAEIDTKAKLFSIIGHDLKGSLNVIMGFSELLTTEIESYSNEEIQEYLKLIYGSADHANDLLVNLLKWALIQTDQIRFSPGILSLFNLIEEVLTRMNEQILAKEIHLTNTSEQDIRIEADEEMLKTILRNLISNAVKYSQQGGEIIINTTRKENRVLISVSDLGIGIDEETLQNLFETVQNPSISGTKNETGTGLGLIICKDFAERHHGTLRVQSTPENGTTFYLDLPVRAEESD